MKRIMGKDNRKEKPGSGYGYIHTTREAAKSKTNWICLKHKTVSRSWMMASAPKCPTCQKDMINIGHRTRVPKKNASNWIWRNFRKLFENKIGF